MFCAFYPCAYARDVFSIDYQALFDNGYRGILFDVDNTLVHHNEDTTPAVDALLEKIAAIGLKTILVSNNSAQRLSRFTQSNGVPFVSDANKPEPEAYEQAVQRLGISKAQALVIGDQMFVDIHGANRAGLDSILVHYIVKNPRAWIGFRRYIEKFVLLIFAIRRSCHTLDYAIKKR